MTKARTDLITQLTAPAANIAFNLFPSNILLFPFKKWKNVLEVPIQFTALYHVITLEFTARRNDKERHRMQQVPAPHTRGLSLLMPSFHVQLATMFQKILLH